MAYSYSHLNCTPILILIAWNSFVHDLWRIFVVYRRISKFCVLLHQSSEMHSLHHPVMRIYACIILKSIVVNSVPRNNRFLKNYLRKHDAVYKILRPDFYLTVYVFAIVLTTATRMCVRKHAVVAKIKIGPERCDSMNHFFYLSVVLRIPSKFSYTIASIMSI